MPSQSSTRSATRSATGSAVGSAEEVLDRQLEHLLCRGVFPLVKLDAAFVVPYGAARRERIRNASDYGTPFGDLMVRVIQALAGKDWPAGSYYPGGWFRALLSRGVNPSTAEISFDALRAFYGEPLRVDSSGRWWLGRKEVRDKVRTYFLRHLEWDAELGYHCVRYPLEGGLEVQYLEAEAPPLRVDGLLERPEGSFLCLNDKSECLLDPTTLWLDATEQLHCFIADRNLQARFCDKARWRILESLEQTDTGPGACWSIRIHGQRINLRVKT